MGAIAFQQPYAIVKINSTINVLFIPLMKSPSHIFITGASSGLGAALALGYAAPGIQLALHGRHQERLKTLAKRVSEKGALVLTFAGDVNDCDQLSQWILECDQNTPLDLVIANAGISAGTDSRYESREQVRTIFSTNLTGVLNTINPILPRMIQRRRGQIALMSSLASFHGMSGSAAYCASKAAVRVYGESLRRQCVGSGVEINVICPGFIKTPMTDVNRFHMPFLMSSEKAARVIKQGLEKNKSRLAFPLLLYSLTQILLILPQSWLDKIFSKLPKKDR